MFVTPVSTRPRRMLRRASPAARDLPRQFISGGDDRSIDRRGGGPRYRCARRTIGGGRIRGETVRVSVKFGGGPFQRRARGIDRFRTRRSAMRRQRVAQCIARQHDLSPLREHRLCAHRERRVLAFLPAWLQRDARERGLAIGEHGPRLQLALHMQQRVMLVVGSERRAQALNIDHNDGDAMKNTGPIFITQSRYTLQKNSALATTMRSNG